ncbi:MAG: hypothetical protein PF440_04680 [Thiomicrorhabdus sp.]|jgi:ribosomal protein L13E|nr:hypothetical protein [Thiomicrorhabdus sp.]
MLLSQEQYDGLKTKGISNETIAKVLAKRGGFKLDNASGYSEDDFSQVINHVINLNEGDLGDQAPATTQAPVMTEEDKRQYRLQKQREYNTKYMGLGKRGVKQGLNTVHASFGAIEALLGDITEKAGLSKAGKFLQEQGMSVYQKQMEDASLYETPQAKDVTGVGSAAKYVYGLAATQLPIILSVVTSGGTAGGLTAIFTKKAAGSVAKRQLIAKVAKAGGMTAVGQLESGLNYGELLQDHGVKAPFSSLAFGALSAYIETLGGNFRVVDDFIKGIARGESGAVLKRLGANLVKTIPTEMGQEAFQEVNSILNVVMNTDEKFLTKENLGRILESGIAGGVMGGGGAVVQTAFNKTVDESKDLPGITEEELDNLDTEDTEVPVTTEEEYQKIKADVEGNIATLKKGVTKLQEAGDVSEKSKSLIKETEVEITKLEKQRDTLQKPKPKSLQEYVKAQLRESGAKWADLSDKDQAKLVQEYKAIAGTKKAKVKTPKDKIEAYIDKQLEGTGFTRAELKPAGLKLLAQEFKDLSEPKKAGKISRQQGNLGEIAPTLRAALLKEPDRANIETDKTNLKKRDDVDLEKERTFKDSDKEFDPKEFFNIEEADPYADRDKRKLPSSKDAENKDIQKLKYSGAREREDVMTPHTADKQSERRSLTVKERQANEQITEAARSDNKLTSPMVVFGPVSKAEEVMDDVKNAIAGLRKKKNIPVKSIPALFEKKLNDFLNQMFGSDRHTIDYEKEFGEFSESWENGFKDPSGKKMTPDQYKALLKKQALELFKKDPYVRLSEKELQKKLNIKGETGLSDDELADVHYYRNREIDNKDLSDGIAYTTDVEAAPENYDEKLARMKKHMAGEYTETGTMKKDGKTLRSVDFPNKKALQDIPREFRPEHDVMGPKILTSLAKKGFIKVIKDKAGVKRWVPVDFTLGKKYTDVATKEKATKKAESLTAKYDRMEEKFYAEARKTGKSAKEARTLAIRAVASIRATDSDSKTSQKSTSKKSKGKDTKTKIKAKKQANTDPDQMFKSTSWTKVTSDMTAKTTGKPFARKSDAWGVLTRFTNQIVNKNKNLKSKAAKQKAADGIKNLWIPVLYKEGYVLRKKSEQTRLTKAARARATRAMQKKYKDKAPTDRLNEQLGTSYDETEAGGYTVISEKEGTEELTSGLTAKDLANLSSTDKDKVKELQDRGFKFAWNTKNKVGGFYLDGRIYLIKENLHTPADILAVFKHEGFHLLVDKNASFKKLYNGLKNSLEKKSKSDPKLRAIYDEIKEIYQEKDWIEETMARYIQDEANVNLPWYKEIISRVKVWLAKTFNKSLGLGGWTGLSGYDLGQVVSHYVQRQLNTPITTPASAKLTYGGIGARAKGLKGVATAARLLSEGKTPEEVFLKTGWFRPTQDNRWRFEISDSGLTVKPEFKNELSLVGSSFKKGITVGDIIGHPELFKHYPWIKNMALDIDVYPNAVPAGTFSPLDKDKDLQYTIDNHNYKISVTAPHNFSLIQGMLHEIQHAIQMEERFARGAVNHVSDVLTVEERKEYIQAYNITRKLDDVVFDITHPNATLQERVKIPISKETYRSILTIHQLSQLAYAQEIAKRLGNSDFVLSRYYQFAGEQEARDVARKFGQFEKTLPKLLSPGLVSLVSFDHARRTVFEHTNTDKSLRFSMSKAESDMADLVSESTDEEKGLAGRLYKNLLAPIFYKGGIEGPKVTKKKQNTSIWTRLFGSSEYDLRKDPAPFRVLTSAKEEDTLNNQIETGISGSFHDRQKEIAKEKGKPYIKAVMKKAQNYLLKVDETGKGYSTEAVLKETTLKREGVDMTTTVRHHVIKNRQGKVIEGLKFNTKQEALDKAHGLEAADLKKLGFNDEAIEMTRLSRELTDRAFDIMIADLARSLADFEAHGLKPEFRRIKMKDGKIHKISIERAIVEMGNLQGTYFPRIRPQGVFTVHAKKGDKKIEKNFSALALENENSFGITNKFKSVINRLTPVERYVRRLQKEGWKVNVDQNKRPTDAVFDIPRLLASMDAILGKAAKEGQKVSNEDTQKALNSMFNQITVGIGKLFETRNTLTSRAARQKDYWQGFETDINRALTNYAQGTAAAEARRITARNMVLAFTGRDISFNDWVSEFGIADENATEENYRAFAKKRAINPVKQKALWEDTQTFISHFLKPHNTFAKAIGIIKTLAVIKYLGWRVSSPAVNMTNMATGVIGTMSAKTNIGIIKSWKLVGHAADTYIRYQTELGRKLGKHKQSAKVTDEERKVYSYISANGFDSPLYNYVAAAAGQQTGSRVFNAISRNAMFMFGYSEKVNRALTIKAAFDAIRQSKTGFNKNHDKLNTEYDSTNKKLKAQAFEGLMNAAKQISDDAHGSYGKASKPWLIQKYKILDLPYTFTKFTHNYMLNMYNVGFNDRQVKEALYLLMAPGFLAGAGASIATPVLNMMFSKIWDDPEEEFYDYIDRAFGSDTFARTGLIGQLTGFSFKGNLEPNIPSFKETKDLLGAPANVFLDVIKAIDHFHYDEYSKATEVFMFSMLGNIVKGKREYYEGITTAGYGPKYYGKEAIKTSEYEFLLRILSLTPNRLQIIGAKQWSEKKQKAKYDKIRKGMLRKYKHYLAKPSGKRSAERLYTLEVARQHYNEQVSELDPNLLVPYATNAWLIRNLKTAFKPSKFERNRQQ